jgi:AcrR family transcriptional regulator
VSNRKERTRQAILEAAWARLERGDASALKLEAVAEAAGVTRQSIYVHFGSRGALLVAVVDYADGKLGLPALLAEVDAAPTARAALAASLSVTARYAARVHPAAKALDRARESDPDANVAYESRMERRRAGLKAIVSRLGAEGQLRPGWTSGQVVDALWAVGIPETYDALVLRRGWSVAAYERLLTQLADSFLVPSRKTARGRRRDG